MNDDVLKTFDKSLQISSFYKDLDFKRFQKNNEISTGGIGPDCMCLINNKKLACGFKDGMIKIYCLITGQCESMIFGHAQRIICLCELENGNLVSSSLDQTIKVWATGNNSNLLLGGKEEKTIFKIVQLSNKNLVTCSEDGMIKLWRTSPIIECFQATHGHNGAAYSVIELKNKKVIVSGGEDCQIRYWEASTFSNFQTISGVNFKSSLGLIEVSNNRLIVGGCGVIYILDSISCQIQEQIPCGYLERISTVVELIDGTVLLGSCDGTLYQLDLIGKEFISKTNDAHSSNVTSLICWNNNIIISGSLDNTIKFWEYHPK